ncbi:uncharacterized protein TRIADDRAFT_55536 [Trichoplax adhaerens]|uniref:Uncharacterized protein n=1 Tax=Trichoplax adhaerens TaxID=10228 RepID=B3RV59_TRIAD|nr:predicted protein [Trichoplax adhaerens]EDV25444.1 predicted protein [Trichoplax adhaerens]|eukprot:XP_002111477.1 predicted protein [Trichoplax adhaerens]
MDSLKSKTHLLSFDVQPFPKNDGKYTLCCQNSVQWSSLSLADNTILYSEEETVYLENQLLASLYGSQFSSPTSLSSGACNVHQLLEKIIRAIARPSKELKYQLFFIEKYIDLILYHFC